MTKMELLNAIVVGGVVSEEMEAKAKEWAVTLAKRAEKPSKAQAENVIFKAQILEFLGTCEGAVTAAYVAEGTGILKGKVVALLGQLAKAGEVVAEKGKGKAPMSYKVA